MINFRLAALAVFLLLPFFLYSQKDLDVRHTEDVVYARKFGTALTLDVFQPASQNGRGIVYIVSGGWFSSHDIPDMVHVRPDVYRPFLARGYTVFAVVHGSQPRYIIPEIIQDIHRAVRFVRYRSAEFGIDPNRLGITGSSSGGQLALMIATQGASGPSGASDPIDRTSSAVQAVACFFPPTDFLNWDAPGVDALGRGPLAPLKPAFGPLADTPEGREILGKEISPIYFVSSKLPPILIVHGDADQVVPIAQSEKLMARAKEMNASPIKLLVRKGKGHGWADYWKSSEDVEAFADWFDQYLQPVKNTAVQIRD